MEECWICLKRIVLHGKVFLLKQQGQIVVLRGNWFLAFMWADLVEGPKCMYVIPLWACTFSLNGQSRPCIKYRVTRK